MPLTRKTGTPMFMVRTALLYPSAQRVPQTIMRRCCPDPFFGEDESVLRTTNTLLLQAPEVFIGNYGVEADVWAAGMMLYQLIADRFPFWQTMEELHTTTLEEVRAAAVCRFQRVLETHFTKEVVCLALDLLLVPDSLATDLAGFGIKHMGSA